MYVYIINIYGLRETNDTCSQEVRQADPEAATRGPRVCCKLCQLQSFEEGKLDGMSQIIIPGVFGSRLQGADIILAYQEALCHTHAISSK